MSPGKSSPVIRKDLFLTGDQSQYGGKGEPSKTAPQRGVLLVPPNCAALVRGTGRFCLTKDNGSGSSLLLVPPNCAALVRGTGRVCLTDDNGSGSTLLLVLPNCAALVRGTGRVILLHSSDNSDGKILPSLPIIKSALWLFAVWREYRSFRLTRIYFSRSSS